MNLNISQWKTFTIKKLFPKLVVGSANQGMLSEGSDCFYVGAKRNDNGVMLHCQRDEDLILKGNCIIFICNGEGSVGYANYMDRDFIGTTDIVAGYNENLNYLNGVFLTTVISKERTKYSFGRKWKTHLKDTEIKLPIQHNIDGSVLIDGTHEYSDEGYIPDWKFMEDYIKGLHHKPISTNNLGKKAKDLNIKDWKEFCLKDYFDLKRGHTLTVEMQEEYSGTFPCVNGTLENNGVQYYLSEELEVIGFNKIKAPAISIVRVGEGGKTFVQNQDFFIADNAFALIPLRTISTFALLFISTVLNKESIKYSYGRTVTNAYKESIIKLPAILNPQTNKYEPDWQFMENYIKSLPYGDRI